MVSERTSERTFLGIAGLLFISCAVLTFLWCRSMSSMGFMLMPGGWTMSMTWMRMAGQTWAKGAASFLGMWLVMMVAMMLPSATPMLMRYRRIVKQLANASLGRLTAIASVAYFLVWTFLGAIVYGLGTMLAAFEMKNPTLARCVPIVAAMCVFAGGMLQFTPWKAHHLACCRLAPEFERSDSEIPRAWRQGLSFGYHCSCCCLNLTAIFLVFGVMDIGAMATVMAAITLERLAPAGETVPRCIGGIAIGLGSLLFLRALDLV